MTIYNNIILDISNHIILYTFLNFYVDKYLALAIPKKLLLNFTYNNYR